MKFRKYLGEEYFGIIQTWDKNPIAEIRVNPSGAELRGLLNNKNIDVDNYHIRFIAFPDKNEIYCWNAYFAAHDDIIKKFAFDQYKAFWGNGPLINGKIQVGGGDFKCGLYPLHKSHLRKFEKYLDFSELGALDALDEEYVGLVTPEWLTYPTGPAGPAELFINPTQREMAGCRTSDEKRIRFLMLLRKNKLYVWTSEKALHYDVAQYLKISYITGCTLWGQAEIEGSKIKIGQTGYISFGSDTRLEDLQIASRYFDVTELEKHYKERW